MSTTTAPSELPPTTPSTNNTRRNSGNWKNRFLRRGSSSKEAFRQNHSSHKSDGTHEHSTHSEELDPATSLAQTRRNSHTSKKKTAGGIIRKLKTSFRREDSTARGGEDSSARDLDDEEEGAVVVAGDSSSPSNPQSPYSTESLNTVESNDRKEGKDLFQWQDAMEERNRREIIFRKQQIKERDGFCRRVDAYDGQVVTVDNMPTYELGSYLGGGVAGVVYEGHRLRPMEDYPVRTGVESEVPMNNNKSIEEPVSPQGTGSFFCAPVEFVQTTAEATCGDHYEEVLEEEEQTTASPSSIGAINKNNTKKHNHRHEEEADFAIEATTVGAHSHGVLLDAQDAPSRSKHFAKAASVQINPRKTKNKQLRHGLTEETVAIKILNPVGFRILPPEGLDGGVVVKEGEQMDMDVKKGVKPMEEKHVWWLVNPNSRNLRTLQRYSGNDANELNAGTAPRGVHIDRGTPGKGLRLSLIAAYIDPRTDKLRELTLTRCIEIWGHVPFSATDRDFEGMMTAIERVNAGQPPPPLPAFATTDDHPPSRVGTDSSTSHSMDRDGSLAPSVPLSVQRTGLSRAASTHRATVFCDSLNAFIALPAVPSKYLRWLRQRRAVTKEIRNMMLIGRHKNVVHLFEVLEYIQDSKSTMFLILELVRGGELFDLISNNAKNTSVAHGRDGGVDETEVMMRKFFFELASGIHYCHANGIAHRDLKPENLLVHNGPDGKCTLKIADFGLSATFGPNGRTNVIDNDTLVDILGSPLSQLSIGDGEERSFCNPLSPASQTSALSPSPIKHSMDKFIQSGAQAFSFLTCGAMETINLCAPTNDIADDENNPSPLRRMTSVVGSPHYVAPEIISQTEDRSSSKKKNGGYDGSKADVWSAGVILYAMLFRSLPFGEDLLRCPRYQSYRKWYDDVRTKGGRRSSSAAALNKFISDTDEHDFLGPHWFFPSTTTPESRDLIVAMLNPLPKDRLTASQVLQHPWLVQERNSNTGA